MANFYFIYLQGVLGSDTNAIESPHARSYTWGMTDDLGAIEPDLVDLTIESGKWSPRILKAFVTKQEIGTAKIRVYGPTISGTDMEIQRLTLTGAVIKYHHVSATNDGLTLDTIRMSYQSIEFKSEESIMSWSVPA
jgi:type VI protein secretion system component Hcp